MPKITVGRFPSFDFFFFFWRIGQCNIKPSFKAWKKYWRAGEIDRMNEFEKLEKEISLKFVHAILESVKNEQKTNKKVKKA